MKLITTIKMSQAEKTSILRWLEKIQSIDAPCAHINCEGIKCSQCPFDELGSLREKIISKTATLLDSIEVSE